MVLQEGCIITIDLMQAFLNIKDYIMDFSEFIAEAKYELIAGAAILIPIFLIFREDKKWPVVVIVFILMLLFKYYCGGFESAAVILFDFFHVDW